jgi:uncharacterized coiled-coil DUF342 family protein
MSDFLKKLKGIFVVEDESNTSNTASSTTVQNSVNKPTVETQASPVTIRVDTVDANLNPKFNDILLQSLQNANQSGFDYIEFKQSIQNLANMPMDEKTKFQSAYAMAQTMGVNTQKLVDSALYYMDILKNEQRKFDEAHEKQRSLQVGNKEIEISSLSKDIDDKVKLMEELKKQMDQNQSKINQLKNEISESTQKVEETNRDFNYTYNLLVDQINKDITNIKNYL